MSYSHTMHRSRAACCCQVSEESGSLSLFTRGLDVTLIGSVPSIAFYFGAYQFFLIFPFSIFPLLSLFLGPYLPSLSVWAPAIFFWFFCFFLFIFWSVPSIAVYFGAYQFVFFVSFY